jgi:hypothetical protein
MAAISLLFLLNIVDQLQLLSYFTEDMGEKGTLTVAVFLCHIFNYLDFYQMVLWVGFILLVPDIVHEEYMERQYLMRNRNRMQAAGGTWLCLTIFSVLYVLWFVILTIIVAGIQLRNFSWEWPHFIKVLCQQYSTSDTMCMSLIMLPKGALEYPSFIVVGMILLRTSLGFLFLAEVACLVRLISGKIQYGIMCVVVMIEYAGFLYYEFYYGIINYWKPGQSLYGDNRTRIDLIKTTIVPFFTFRSMTDDFTEWICYGILMGLALVLVTGIGIVCYYKKGDLGDADRDA